MLVVGGQRERSFHARCAGTGWLYARAQSSAARELVLIEKRPVTRSVGSADGEVARHVARLAAHARLEGGDDVGRRHVLRQRRLLRQGARARLRGRRVCACVDVFFAHRAWLSEQELCLCFHINYFLNL